MELGDIVVLLIRAGALALLAYGAWLSFTQRDVLGPGERRAATTSARTSRLWPEPLLAFASHLAAAAACVAGLAVFAALT